MKSRIVIVDDKLHMAELVRKYLEIVGYQNVLTFSNPTLALEQITQSTSTVKLVITDDDMPEMTGTEVIAAVNEYDPAIPTILMTGGSLDQLTALPSNCPVLNKHVPMFISELEGKVREALNVN